MKSLFNLSLSLILTMQSVSALSVKGSPDRCKKDDWSQIDTLLPVRSLNGGYPQPMTDIDQKISKVTPQEMMQSVVDHVLTYYDLCGEPVAGVGGWTDGIGTDLCERMALYNVTHDGVLSGEGTKSAKPLYSDEDLAFLKSVFKACRPTTTRYWNYPLIAHVSFEPTKEEYDHFDKLFKNEFMPAQPKK